MKGLNRKQKILRNSILAALLLFLAAWVMDFPVPNETALQRRAERYFFLEETELLHRGRYLLYLGDGTNVYRIGYRLTPLGLQYVSGQRFEGLCVEASGQEKWECKAVGYLEGAAQSQLELAFTSREGGEDAPRVLQAQGERESPYVLHFSFPEAIAGEDWVVGGRIFLWDGEGQALPGREVSLDLREYW